MQNHQVEVDEEVFAYVQQHAEPLIDDFNSTIKRLLGASGKHKKHKNIQPTISASQPTPIPGLNLPREAPQSLRHILEVAYLVSKQGESRTDATRSVAKIHKVTPQTVLDKYCRQLNLTAAEFDRLLYEPNLISLRKMLKAKFYEYNNLIDNVLSDSKIA